ncbi:hypothetical protein KAR91_22000 [Candidatus Pacearchaeota archaeon]|nr:hypothetical protein [Candidatus Pacearchaeota archaeon]
MAEFSVDNVWLESQGKRIDYLLHEIEKYRLSGAYGGELNLTEIVSLFKGAKIEIRKLQNEINGLKSEACGENCICKNTNKDITPVDSGRV